MEILMNSKYSYENVKHEEHWHQKQFCLFRDSFKKIFVISVFESDVMSRHKWMKDFNTKYLMNNNDHLLICI